MLFFITSTVNLKNGLDRKWTIQWKINFNPDFSKQVSEVIFSRKLKEKNHNSVYLDDKTVQQVLSEIHLGMYLDTKLNFSGIPK